MTRQGLLRSPAVSAANNKKPLLAYEDDSTSSVIRTPTPQHPPKTLETKRLGKKIGEVAGGTAAECAAVCCCCPCAVVNLVVLAVYKVPAAVCRKAWRRTKRRRLIKKRQELLLVSGRSNGGESQLIGVPRIDPTDEIEFGDEDLQSDVVELEKEMWDQFYGTGFWRSPSQKATP